MSNPKIEVDISEIFKEIKEELKSTNTYLKKIDEKIDNIDKRLIAVETNQSYIKEQLSDLKGTQKNQIWSLIAGL
ncbi:MAG: hypothetical protein QNJ41_20860 [Xenococcaceae cyanobacterium MO_188.B32]|nr:hypothetical protein [Xenococcaceae cyanobacterium MO_188.B32]